MRFDGEFDGLLKALLRCAINFDCFDFRVDDPIFMHTMEFIELSFDDLVCSSLTKSQRQGLVRLEYAFR